jgi:hypothetical protein
VVQYLTKYALLSKNMATSIMRASTYPQPHSHTQKPPLLRSGMVPVDYEPRALESGFGTAELGSDEDGSMHKVLGDLSVIPQVKAKFRTSLGALKCQNDCHCRCHNRLSRRILPRNLSTYLGHAFLGYSNLPWYLSSLVQCSEQTCRRSKNLTADLRYFLPTWFSVSRGGVQSGRLLTYDPSKNIPPDTQCHSVRLTHPCLCPGGGHCRS